MSNHRLVGAMLTGSSLMLGAGIACAAPPAPEFELHKVPFAKVDDGEIRAPGGRSFIVDGHDVYAAVVRHQFDQFAADQVSSRDGGVTWGPAHQMGRPKPQPISPYAFRLALSPDPGKSGQKLLHATWVDASGGLLNYSYSHAGKGDWSVPVTSSGIFGSGTENSLAADSSGGIHFINADGSPVLYVETTVAGGPFSTPVGIATNVTGHAFHLSALEIDEHNNLYVVVPNQPELVLMKKASGSSTWQSFPITADKGNAEYQGPTLLVIDSNHISVAYGFVPVVGGVVSSPSELRFAHSKDGGMTWNRRSVEVDSPSVYHASALAMSADDRRPVLTLATSDNKGLSIFRSDDGFKTSNRTSMNLGDNVPYIGVDGKGKTLLMVGGFDSRFTTIFPASAVYFLREVRHE